MLTFTRQMNPLQLILNVMTIKSKRLCMLCTALRDIAFFPAPASPVFGLSSLAILNFGLPEWVLPLSHHREYSHFLKCPAPFSPPLLVLALALLIACLSLYLAVTFSGTASQMLSHHISFLFSVRP